MMESYVTCSRQRFGVEFFRSLLRQLPDHDLARRYQVTLKLLADPAFARIRHDLTRGKAAAEGEISQRIKKKHDQSPRTR